ncbi:hypothetical protein AB0E59_32000 [Lentzea sp. NPDC034063]|uniref:hypothetical protein n=1 Tax=unclassified Lentzea TaxID=2643253 RepID=UPI0033F4FAB5
MHWDVTGDLLGECGPIRLGGFKHLLAPVLAAAAMSDRPWSVTNVPDIRDSHMLAAMLRDAGAEVVLDTTTRSMTVDARSLTRHRIDSRWSTQVHGGTYLLPALLAATGRAESGAHGGCQIGGGSGKRPIAHLAEVMSRFGAVCEVDGDAVTATAPASGLRGTEIDLADFAEVEPVSGTLTGPHYSGASKTALLLAAAARGTTVLRNPYPKPDTVELARILGAHVERDLIVVEGAGGPIGAAAAHLPSDLMELVTFVAIAVAARRAVRLRLDRPELVREGLAPELGHLAEMGVPLRWDGDLLDVEGAHEIRPARIVAASHLAYSDAQPLFALMLSRATGPSVLTDAVWHNRFGYADGLGKLGADLTVRGHALEVRPSTLRPSGEDLRAGDLRAVATVVLGALVTGGRHRVHGVEHIGRGYEGLPEKLTRLGAHIETSERIAA